MNQSTGVMMTDRELLEKAAKAARLSILNWQEANFFSNRVGIVADVLSQGDWNALTDDGDALGLAVRLKLTVKIVDHEIEVFDKEGECLISTPIDDGMDMYVSTHRAIVLAAAAMADEKE